MNIKSVALIISLLILFSSGLSKSIQKKVNKEIKDAFSTVNFEISPLLFTEEVQKELPAPFGALNLFEIRSETDKIGYAYIGKSFGKTDDFDFLILFDPDFIIVRTKVLIYREDYGGEIGSKRWLKQFNGKGQNDELKLHKNIVAISGATISVKVMTASINRVLASIKLLHEKELL